MIAAFVFTLALAPAADADGERSAPAPSAIVDDAPAEATAVVDDAPAEATAVDPPESAGVDDARAARDDDARAIAVDVVGTVLATPASSGLGALHTPFVGARVGLLWPRTAPGPLALVWGVDGALLAGGFGSGTSFVRADRAALAGTVRGLVGPRIGGSGPFSLLPFAMLQGTVLGGATLVRVDESMAVRPLVAAGMHAGVGLTLALFALSLTLETGVGFLGLAPSTLGTLSLGYRF